MYDFMYALSASSPSPSCYTVRARFYFSTFPSFCPRVYKSLSYFQYISRISQNVKLFPENISVI